ncbi:hypothetical protein HO722_03540 [Streptococcus suis]|uniref:hypothetical protein n=1 Tax=Streptococcus suis TaxID=1307 RepID=UPI0005CDCA56|nr:hypothetical protein [Streptococcus suis]NQF64744.1 hypothetical protein [Streptococcus suis]CYW29130.1 Uncharacterised protein [Streptococcus suis]
MMEAQDNFKSKPTNIAYLNNATAKTKPSLPLFNDIIESRKQQEESIMPQETYTKSEIDLKFEKLSTNVQHSSEKSDLKFDALAKQVDLKFDNFENKLENLFANLKVELANEKIESLEQARKDKRELILWSIGTAVAILGILIPLILNK